MTNTCKNCVFWKNNQRELNYSDSTGICLSPGNNFNINTGRIVGVLDMQNLKNRATVSGNCSHDLESVESSIIIGKIQPSRYLLATDETFGCNRHELINHFHKE